jgi:hypothetical protein
MRTLCCVWRLCTSNHQSSDRFNKHCSRELFFVAAILLSVFKDNYVSFYCNQLSHKAIYADRCRIDTQKEGNNWLKFVSYRQYEVAAYMYFTMNTFFLILYVLFFINICMVVFLRILIVMSIYSYCMFTYLHRASWHSSATLTEVFRAFSSVVRQMSR